METEWKDYIVSSMFFQEGASFFQKICIQGNGSDYF